MNWAGVLVGGKPADVKKVKISETMRLESESLGEALGLWEQSTGSTIIRRDRLQSPRLYAGTLLHEISHVKSGSSDISRGFEEQLTSFVGLIAAKALDSELRSGKQEAR
jgi:hypothetical protein